MKFNMFVIRKVAEVLGCELHEIGQKLIDAQTGDPGVYYDVCLAALHYGNGNTSDDMTETEKSVESLEQLKPAGEEFVKAYTAFFGIKGDAPEGE